MTAVSASLPASFRSACRRGAVALARRAEPVRTPLLRAVLALVLVLAQTGALTHLLGHAAEVPQARSASTRIASDDRAPVDAFGVCLQCLALGGLDLPRPARARLSALPRCPRRHPVAPDALAHLPTPHLEIRCRCATLACAPPEAVRRYAPVSRTCAGSPPGQ